MDTFLENRPSYPPGRTDLRTLRGRVNIETFTEYSYIYTMYDVKNLGEEGAGGTCEC